MDYFIFIMFLMGSATLGGTLIYLIGEKRLKHMRRKNTMALKNIIENFNGNKLKPILKEKNITNFLYQEEEFKFEVAYNQTTIYAKIRTNIDRDSESEIVFSFEYDTKNKKLIFTNREGYIYNKYDLYEIINYHLSLFIDKMIQIDWESKQYEPIAKIEGNKNLKKVKRKENDDILNNKVKTLLKNIEFLEKEEVENLHINTLNELDKTVSFYNKLNITEKEKYQPVVFDKLKEIEDEIEKLINNIEERKYLIFKERLKKISIEED